MILLSNPIDHTGGVAELVREKKVFFIRIYNTNTKYEISQKLATTEYGRAIRSFRRFLESASDCFDDIPKSSAVPDSAHWATLRGDCRLHS